MPLGPPSGGKMIRDPRPLPAFRGQFGAESGYSAREGPHARGPVNGAEIHPRAQAARAWAVTAPGDTRPRHHGPNARSVLVARAAQRSTTGTASTCAMARTVSGTR